MPPPPPAPPPKAGGGEGKRKTCPFSPPPAFGERRGPRSGGAGPRGGGGVLKRPKVAHAVGERSLRPWPAVSADLVYNRKEPGRMSRFPMRSAECGMRNRNGSIVPHSPFRIPHSAVDAAL